MSTKRKRLQPRREGDETPPSGLFRRRQRLASEPTSRRLRLTDRWEPGFLRLAGAATDRELSYVVDGIGIYYDATAPSELETLLEDGGWETAELDRRSQDGIATLRRIGLSIDNDPRRRPLVEVLAAVRPPENPDGEGQDGAPRRRVAIVDQPREDGTIGFGLAGPARFTLMLETAAAENPGAELVVVMDPSVPATARTGYLDAEVAAACGATMLREPVEAWSVVEACERLYVLTAHVGFEAALAGRQVTCFGLPFYSGWGFTDDRLGSARRTRRRSPEEVFAAAYLVYSRYFDPFDGRPSTFEAALDTLALAGDRARENAEATLCVGFAPWKRRWINTALGAPGFRPVVTQRKAVGAADLQGAERVIAWASREPSGLDAACREVEVPYWRMEDGFLRSVGLGVGLRPGASYVLDRSGIYYDATRPSDLETLLETGVFDEPMLARAARLREAIVRARLSKYNVGHAGFPDVPRDRPVLLVAGQVENDASLRLGAADLGGNVGLLRRVRHENPDATIVYKPHPDVEAGLRPGRVPAADLAMLADVVISDVSAHDAIEAVDRVEVATSLIGFEALLRGKAVRTHGLPFYAGWGLTSDPGSPRRTRRLALEELVAGALILYPRYLDPRTGLACSPEVLVRRLSAGEPNLTRRERTLEAFLKEAWSVAFRRTRGARG